MRSSLKIVSDLRSFLRKRVQTVKEAEELQKVLAEARRLRLDEIRARALQNILFQLAPQMEEAESLLSTKAETKDCNRNGASGKKTPA
ncbi:hypothetical protein COW82_01745 [Candidatus Campbellbacteria bacterium CG22_combo_CG10-13_8_21_14_all_43_18]|uniref:Uncharacterized protein n=1 Tax=Candidatus Campbellbacteria bacterium CG22_combo_CG10-13_8_21_14_all_43_18 TaxID=1974530 RepID=A0A2H0DWW1_9BACT|nr:MAG: hypothetical protein COW82_01745 [Candidatus Campbellbacteria bacterium CG22_combo_CG10-13_8_21_14_all_43_18]